MSNRVRVSVPHDQKPKVGKLLKEVKECEKSSGPCLFVVDEDGRKCRNVVRNNCHVIPQSAVLGELQDGSSGQVLELWWGAARWQHQILSANESNPFDLNDSSAFDPQSVGVSDACVGRFACKAKCMDHDGEFGQIDVKEPEFSDPGIRLLSMYRVALYTVDVDRIGIRMVKAWNKKAMTQHDKRVHRDWIRYSNKLKTGQCSSEAIARRLGECWYAWKFHGEAKLDIVAEQRFYVNSRLKFALSGFSTNGVAVLVVPVGDDRHKMSILHLREDEEKVRTEKERLIQLASECASTDSGVQVVQGLMKEGWGAVAASPESYRELSDVEKQTIGRVVAESSSADMLASVLASREQPPRRSWPKTSKRRRK